MKKFCQHQIKCEEDTKDTRTCQAHLAEGRAFQCPYHSIKDAREKQYPCMDAEAV